MRSRRTTTRAQRRGLAGGWLQRRRPPQSRKTKAVGALKKGLPSSKGGMAAGLALLGAAGVALRKRMSDGDHSQDTPTTVPATPPTATSTPSTPVSPTTNADAPGTTTP